MLLSPWVMGRKAELWKDPLTFDPDRFNSEHHPFSWIPFGAGRRRYLYCKESPVQASPKYFLSRLFFYFFL